MVWFIPGADVMWIGHPDLELEQKPPSSDRRHRAVRGVLSSGSGDRGAALLRGMEMDGGL